MHIFNQRYRKALRPDTIKDIDTKERCHDHHKSFHSLPDAFILNIEFCCAVSMFYYSFADIQLSQF